MEYEDNWKPDVQFGALLDLQIEDNKNCPAFRGLSSPSSTNTRELWQFNGDKVPHKAYTGSKKSYHRNQTRDFKYSVEYDRVLSQ